MNFKFRIFYVRITTKLSTKINLFSKTIFKLKPQSILTTYLNSVLIYSQKEHQLNFWTP